jgi:hypothetical protein
MKTKHLPATMGMSPPTRSTTLHIKTTMTTPVDAAALEGCET